MGLNNNKYCKNQQREKSKKKKNETVASGEKRQMQNNADILPVSKQGVFITKETQEEQGKKKQYKTKNQ
jgi:hypothetical protein